MKKVLILAGVHGNEKSAQLLAIELLHTELDFANLDITILPVVNPTGSLSHTREYVNKNTHDLNRINTYKTEEMIRNTIISEINKCDLLIDIHNSPNCGNFCLFDNIHDYSAEIALLSACNVEYAHWNSKNYVNKTVAKSQGKLAITYEFKGMIADKCDEYNKAKRDIMSILSAYNDNSNSALLDNTANTAVKRDICMLYAPSAGFVEYHNPVNTIVELSQPICTIYQSSYNFKLSEDILAPCRLKIIGYENEFVEAGSEIVLYLKEFVDV